VSLLDARWHENVVGVTAPDAADAAERAVEKADNDPHWEPLDDCGPTFIANMVKGCADYRVTGSAGEVEVAEGYR
jgi:hypothetical protein